MSAGEAKPSSLIDEFAATCPIFDNMNPGSGMPILPNRVRTFVEKGIKNNAIVRVKAVDGGAELEVEYALVEGTLSTVKITRETARKIAEALLKI